MNKHRSIIETFIWKLMSWLLLQSEHQIKWLRDAQSPSCRAQNHIRSSRIIKSFGHLRLCIKVITFSSASQLNVQESPFSLFLPTRTQLLDKKFVGVSLNMELNTHNYKNYKATLSHNCPRKEVSACLKFLSCHLTRRLSCPCLGDTKSLHYVTMYVHTVGCERNRAQFQSLHLQREENN